jgi:16S rRNA (adenine1518-N6/adenine1519-N6)-dimethyltransferase
MYMKDHSYIVPTLCLVDQNREVEMLKQRKSLSQSFLQSDEPCHQLVETLPDSQKILEIGPGQGILTKCLLKRFSTLHTVEKDERFHQLLLNQIPEAHHTLADVLDLDFSPYEVICGNIPYHISSPILQKVIQAPSVHAASFLVQKEFAERIASPPGSKSFGSLSVYTQLYFDTTISVEVSRDLFFPVPQVDSAIVVLRRITPARQAPEVLKKAETLSRVAFHQRRKKLRNTWKPHLPMTETACPVDLDLRPENLSVEQFIQMALYSMESS